MALLLDLKKGDEVIMHLTLLFQQQCIWFALANLFLLIYILDTLNMNENLVEKAITSKQKQLLRSYAGVACEMDKLKKLQKA
jgi:dTDP-4-amino-4,6-dideoxygalactose transaminase